MHVGKNETEKMKLNPTSLSDKLHEILVPILLEFLIILRAQEVLCDIL